jgi:hypothetical protein
VWITPENCEIILTCSRSRWIILWHLARSRRLHAWASQLNFYQYTIMNSFMLPMPHTTKNIGANNIKQQTTNHQHNGSNGLDVTESSPVTWCKGPTMPHLQ